MSGSAPSQKDPTAIARGRLGGLAAARNMTAAQRSERARKAGHGRKLKCTCGHCPTCYQREYHRRWRAARRRTNGE